MIARICHGYASFENANTNYMKEARIAGTKRELHETCSKVT